MKKLFTLLLTCMIGTMTSWAETATLTPVADTYFSWDDTGTCYGTEETLYQLEQEYDLNCLFLLAIASHESAYGTAQFHPNNVCGYGSKGFSSINECLETVGRALANSYLSPSGAYYKGSTIAAVNRTYAADGSWNVKVAKKVANFYQVISENHNAQLEKLK